MKEHSYSVAVSSPGDEHFYHWQTRFATKHHNGDLVVTVRIAFKNATDKQERQWEKAIEAIWSNKIACNGEPIIFDVVITKSKAAHHSVYVHQSDGNGYDMFDYYAKSMDKLAVAHEFGHLIGAYDNYPWGATERVIEGVLMSDPSTRTATILPEYMQFVAASQDNGELITI